MFRCIILCIPDSSRVICVAGSAACCSAQAVDTPSLRSITVERGMDVIQVAAAVKGEVQPWVWLLRALSDRYNLQSAHAGVHYLVGPTDFIMRLFHKQLFLPRLGRG